MKKSAITRVFSSNFASSCNGVAWIRGVSGQDSRYLVLGGGRIAEFGSSSREMKAPYIIPIPFRMSLMAVSIEGRYVAVTGVAERPDIHVFRDSESTPTFVLQDHDDSVAALSFSLDSKYLVSVGISGSLFIFDLSDGSITRRTYIGPGLTLSCVYAAGFERDVKRRTTNTYLFGCCGPKTLSLLRFSPGDCLQLVQCTSRNPRVYTGCVVRPDGSYMYVASLSGDVSTVCIKTRSATLANPLVIPGSGGISSFTHGGDSTLLSGCNDGSICTIRAEGESLHLAKRITVEPHSAITSLSHLGGRVLIGTHSGSLWILDSDHIGSEPRRIWDLPTGPVNQLVPISISGKDYSFLSVSNQLVKYTGSSSEVIFRNPALQCAAVSELVYLAADPERVYGLDPRHPLSPPVWHFPVRGATGLALTRSVKTCVLSTSEGDLRVYDLRTRDMKLSLRDHAGRVSGLRLFQDQSFALTCGRDHNLISYDLLAGRQVSCHRDPENGINAMALLDDNSTVVTGGTGKLLLWDLRVMDPVGIHRLPNSEVTCMWSMEDSIASTSELVFGNSNGAVHLMDLRTMNCIGEPIFHHAGTVLSVCGSADWMISGGSDNTVSVIERGPAPSESPPQPSTVISVPKLVL